MKLMLTKYAFSNTETIVHGGSFKNIDNGVVLFNLSYQVNKIIYSQIVSKKSLAQLFILANSFLIIKLR